MIPSFSFCSLIHEMIPKKFWMQTYFDYVALELKSSLLFSEGKNLTFPLRNLLASETAPLLEQTARLRHVTRILDAHWSISFWRQTDLDSKARVNFAWSTTRKRVTFEIFKAFRKMEKISKFFFFSFVVFHGVKSKCPGFLFSSINDMCGCVNRTALLCEVSSTTRCEESDLYDMTDEFFTTVIVKGRRCEKLWNFLPYLSYGHLFLTEEPCLEKFRYCK